MYEENELLNDIWRTEEYVETKKETKKVLDEQREKLLLAGLVFLVFEKYKDSLRSIEQ